MKKDELISILQSIEGNLEIVFEDTEVGYKLAKTVTKIKLHEEINGKDYIEDREYNSAEPGTYSHDAVNKNAIEFIKIS